MAHPTGGGEMPQQIPTVIPGEFPPDEPAAAATGHDRPANVTPFRGRNDNTHNDEPDVSSVNTANEREEQERQTLKRGEIITGASHREAVDIPEETRHNLADLLKKRQQQVTRLIERPDYQPSDIDLFIKSLTPEQIAAVESGQMTRQELGNAWFAVADEILLLRADLGEVSEMRVRQRRLRLTGIRFHRRLETTGRDIGQRLTSEYAKRSGSAEWKRQQVDQLERTRIALEMSLYGRAQQNFLFDQGRRALSISPNGLSRESANQMWDTVAEQLEDIMQQRYRRPGQENFPQLMQGNPALAIQVAHEALNRALPVFNSSQAREILTRRKPGSTDAATAINRHIGRITGEPDPAEVRRLEHEITQAQSQESDAINAFNEVNRRWTEMQAIRQAPVSARREVIRANAEIGQTEMDLTTAREELARHETNRLNRAGERRGTRGLAEKAGMSTAGSINAQIEQDLQRLDGQIERQRTRIEGLENTLRERERVAQEKADALQEAEQRVTREADNATFDALTNERNTARDLRNTRHQAVLRHQEELRNLQSGGEQDADIRRRGFQAWLDAMQDDKWGKVIASCYVPDYENTEYSRKALASGHLSAQEVDGQRYVEGVDRIREHIFRIMDPGGYNEALARRMVPDSVVRTIVAEVLNVDVTPFLAAADRNNPLFEQNYTRSVISHMQIATQTQVAEVLRRIIDTGVKSAARGNPFSENPNQLPHTPTSPLQPQGPQPPPEDDGGNPARRPPPPPAPAPNTPDANYYDMSLRPGYIPPAEPQHLPPNLDAVIPPEPPPTPFNYQSGEPPPSQSPATNEPMERYFDASLRPGFEERDLPSPLPRNPAAVIEDTDAIDTTAYQSRKPLPEQERATNEPRERYFDTSLRPGFLNREEKPSLPRVSVENNEEIMRLLQYETGNATIDVKRKSISLATPDNQYHVTMIPRNHSLELAIQETGYRNIFPREEGEGYFNPDLLAVIMESRIGLGENDLFVPVANSFLLLTPSERSRLVDNVSPFEVMTLNSNNRLEFPKVSIARGEVMITNRQGETMPLMTYYNSQLKNFGEDRENDILTAFKLIQRLLGEQLVLAMQMKQ